MRLLVGAGGRVVDLRRAPPPGSPTKQREQGGEAGAAATTTTTTTTTPTTTTTALYSTLVPLDPAFPCPATAAALAPSTLQPEWEIDPAALTLGRVIGEGEFGVVHEARWWGQPVAVKVLRRSGAGPGGGGGGAGGGGGGEGVALGDLRSELAVLQRVHHPQTVQFLGAVTATRPFMIVSEICGGGSVGDLLADVRAGRAPPLPPRRAAELALDCARGLLYLHSRQHLAVIHRDMKPGNILLAAGGHWPPGVDAVAAARAVGVAKISDFGLSKSLQLSGGGAGASATAMTGAYKLTGETGSYRCVRGGRETREERREKRKEGGRGGGGGGGARPLSFLSSHAPSPSLSPLSLPPRPPLQLHGARSLPPRAVRPRRRHILLRRHPV